MGEGLGDGVGPDETGGGGVLDGPCPPPPQAVRLTPANSSGKTAKGPRIFIAPHSPVLAPHDQRAVRPLSAESQIAAPFALTTPHNQALLPVWCEAVRDRIAAIPAASGGVIEARLTLVFPSLLIP